MSLLASNTVAEIQSYYGSLFIAERVIQRIWHDQEFNKEQLLTHKGHLVEIINAGQWNPLEGPDFKNGCFLINGVQVSGDVEIHLYARDWIRHHHNNDPNYNRVVLHVTLFDSPDIRSEPDHRIVMLPYLEEDLECYLTRYMLGDSSGNEPVFQQWMEHFISLQNPFIQHELLLKKARIRWIQKMNFARIRLSKYGWMQSNHQLMMEVLGYRRNRAPMHELALQHPLCSNTPVWTPETLFVEKKDKWKLRGSRPANHPLMRLQGYARILERCSHWPEILRLFSLSTFDFISPQSPELALTRMKIIRAKLKLHVMLNKVKSDVIQGDIGEKRIHTFMGDAFLPLLSVNAEKDFFLHWYHWPVGDCPDVLTAIIRKSELPKVKGSIHCNGWIQGLIQLGLESDY